MTKLILIRHGFSKSNEERVFAGHLDISLAEKGVKQAKITAKYVSENYKIDTIYSSDLKRAKETAEKLGELTGKKISFSKNLREIFAGDWEGHKYEELPVLYPEEFWIWKNKIGLCQTPNGESVKDLYNRVNSEIDRILEENQGKNIVIVSHATAIRVFMVRVLGMNVEEMQKVEWVPNASVSVFDVKNEKITPVLLGENSFHGEIGTKVPNVV